MNQTNKITAFQFYFFVLQSQIGIGILSLPYSLFNAAKTDGWISMLIGGILVQFVTLYHWWLIKRFPGKTLYEINTHLLGSVFGKILNIAYVLYFTLVASLVTVLAIDVLRRWVYHITPAWILILLFMLITVYFAKEDLTKISRFFVLVSFLLIILFLLTLTAYQNPDIRYLFPIGHNGLKTIFLGSKEGVISLLGFESLLILAPFIKTKEATKLKMVMLSNLTVTALYVYITITCYIFFSPDEFLLVPEPVLYLLKAIEYNLVERVDLVFLTIWVVSVLTSVITYTYIAGLGAKTVLQTKSHRPFIPVICFLIFAISLFPAKTDSMAAEMGTFIRPYVYSFIFIIPLVLLGISFMKKEGAAQHESASKN